MFSWVLKTLYHCEKLYLKYKNKYKHDSLSLKQASSVAVQELVGVDKLNTEFMLICGKKE